MLRMYQGIIQQPLCRTGVVTTFAKLKTVFIGKNRQKRDRHANGASPTQAALSGAWPLVTATARSVR